VTFLENIVAFTLTALALVALMALLNTGMFLGTRSEHQIHAEQIVQQLQEAYAQDLAKLGDGVYPLAAVSDSVQGIDYRPRLRIGTYSNDPKAPVRSLEVTVDWDFKGKAFQRSRVRLLCSIPR